MYRYPLTRRAGISLMEVLISIGVISLGIFGVASLIPVAQFKIAQGTSLDRQAAFGPSAVADFRIRGMNSTANWVHPQPNEIFVDGRLARGVVIDPQGFLSGVASAAYFPFQGRNPNSPAEIAWRMPRLNLVSTPNISVAQSVFDLTDDLSFDRPDDEALQPRRQYFVDSDGSITGLAGRPLATAPSAAPGTAKVGSQPLSWFATLSPYATTANYASDEFMLSVVVCQGRVPEAGEEYTARGEAGPFAGELRLQVRQPFVRELAVGDWLLVVKPGVGAMTNPSDKIYRWTKVIGTQDDEKEDVRLINIANDDLLAPGQGVMVFYVNGVQSVFERTVRIENTSTAWD